MSALCATESALLFEGGDGAGFVVLHVEDGVELGDLQQVVDLAGQVQELEFAALVFGCSEGADQLTDAGAVDVGDIAEVEKDVLLAFAQKVAHGITELDAAFAEGDAPAHIQNGDPVDLTGRDFNAAH
jgi:hypothetical protein